MTGTGNFCIGTSFYATFQEAINAAKPEDIIAISGSNQVDTVVIPAELNNVHILASERGTELTSASFPAIRCQGKGITFENFTVVSEGDGPCILVSSSGEVELKGCHITAQNGTGLQIEGGFVQAMDCTVTSCGEYGISVLGGGVFSAEGLKITQCTKTGLLARGKGSTAKIEANSKLDDNKANGAGCDGGGCIIMNDSKVRNNKMVGVNCGVDGMCELVRCKIRDNGLHGMSANAGTITATDCDIRNNKQLGAYITEANSRLAMDSTIIAQSGAHGILVQRGAMLHSQSCKVTGSLQSGIVILGALAEIKLTHVFGNCIDGVHVGQAPGGGRGGHCVLSESKIDGNKRLGVSVFDEGTRLDAEDTVVSENGGVADGGHGIAIVRGGFASIKTCEILDNQQCGVYVQGTGEKTTPSTASVEKSVVEGNNVGVSAEQGGMATCMGVTMRDNEESVVGHVSVKITPGYKTLGGLAVVIAAVAAGYIVWRRHKAGQ